MHDNPLRAIVFDMDGVLCDSMPIVLGVIADLLRERYTLDLRPSDLAPYVGSGVNACLRGVSAAHAVAIDVDRDRAEFECRYLAAIPGRLSATGGATAFVRAMHGCGSPLALATSASRARVDANLREIALSPSLFRAIVTAEDVVRPKSDPEVFLRAVARFGLPPHECLVVEDACNGVRAAKAGGFEVLAVTTSFDAQALHDAGADAVARDLACVPADLLARLGLK